MRPGRPQYIVPTGSSPRGSRCLSLLSAYCRCRGSPRAPPPRRPDARAAAPPRAFTDAQRGRGGAATVSHGRRRRGRRVGKRPQGPARGRRPGPLVISAFETLEKEFQDVLATLAGDESLDEFRAEYEKVHRALVRSHDHERKLIKKVKDLNGEIVNNASKVHTALKLSQDDQQTITTLRAEVEKAWKMVDTAQSRRRRPKKL